MKIKSISVHIGRKITENYNSFDNSVGMTADLGDDDDPHAAVEQLQRKCFAELFKKSPFDKSKKSQVTEQ